MKTNVALIGFMGAGKTAVGKALAKKLNRKFIGIELNKEYHQIAVKRAENAAIKKAA